MTKKAELVLPAKKCGCALTPYRHTRDGLHYFALGCAHFYTVTSVGLVR